MLGTCTCSFALVGSFAAFVLANNAFNNYHFLTKFWISYKLHPTKNQSKSTKKRAKPLKEHQDQIESTMRTPREQEHQKNTRIKVIALGKHNESKH
jgi:hypothetical protein